MRDKLFIIFVLVTATLIAGEKITKKFDPAVDKDKGAKPAILVQPDTPTDWWLNVVDFYRSDDKGKVVLLGAGNVCKQGPEVDKKSINDNEIEIITKEMTFDCEIYGYIIVDNMDRYVAHVASKKKLKEGETLKIKFRFPKPNLPDNIASAKYRCGVGPLGKAPAEKTYGKLKNE